MPKTIEREGIEHMERGPLTYREAELAYAELERLRAEGRLDEAAYRERLHALRVFDDQGRTWMLQEGSGDWFVYDEGQWVQATPPGQPIGMPPPPESPPMAAAPAPTPQPSQRQVQPVETRDRRRRVGCIGLMLRMLVWSLAWIGAGHLLYGWLGTRAPWAMVPLALVATASLVWWLGRLTPRRVSQEVAS